jgi:WD40 repeat protein
MSIKKPRALDHHRVFRLLKDKQPQDRLSYLEMIARQDGSDDVANLIAECAPVRPWSIPWAHWGLGRCQYRVIGKHPGGVTAIAIACLSDEKVIVSAGGDGTIRTWDPSTGRAFANPMRCHDGRVCSIAITEHEGRAVVVSGGGDTTVRIWDLESGQPRLRPLTGHSGWVRSVAVGQLQGRPVVVSAGDDRSVRIWDLESGAHIGTVAGQHEDYILVLALADVDGRTTVISGDRSGEFIVRDLETGALLSGQSKRYQERLTDTQIMEQDGGPVAPRRSNHTAVQPQDLTRPGGTPRPTVHDDAAPTGPDGLLAMAFGHIASSPVLASGDARGTVRLWDVNTGILRGRLCLRRSGVAAITLTDLDSRPAIITGSENGIITVWNLPTRLRHRHRPYRLDLWAEAISIVEFQGSMAAVAGGPGQVIRCWDLATGSPVRGPIRTGHSIFALASGCLNGRAIVVTGGDDGTLRSWDLGRGQALGPPVPVSGGTVRSAALMTTRDELLAVCGTEDGSVHRWDILGNEPPERLALDGTGRRVALGAMLETCGSAGKGASEGGCTFPVTES